MDRRQTRRAGTSATGSCGLTPAPRLVPSRLTPDPSESRAAIHASTAVRSGLLMPLGSRTLRLIGASLALAALVLLSPPGSGNAQSEGIQQGTPARSAVPAPSALPQPDFARMLRDQADT